MQFKEYIQRVNIEMFIWPAALITLFFMNDGPSLCPLKRMGIPWCPGCGLGHAIHYFLHGQLKASFQSHFMGPFATCMLLYRTIQLARLQLQTFSEPKNHHT